MIRELHVKNLAVLESASLELGLGFNVLTGETGAGKSVVVDSLALLAGARASSDWIRTGAESLSVAGVFAVGEGAWRDVLDQAGLEADASGELLIRREVGRNGRNRVFVNDQPATVRLLVDLAPHILRIHGQREELGLTVADQQRAWLDKSGSEEAEPLLATVASRFDEYARLAERLERATGDERARSERLDFLEFQLREIEGARLVAGEDETLRAERDVLRHVEAIVRALGGASDALVEDEGAAVGRIARARTLLTEIASWEPAASAWERELAEIEVRASELAREVSHRLDALEADPARLDAVEERLSIVERLAKKHGGNVDAVIARGQEIATEIDQLRADFADRGELLARAQEALAAYRDAAITLSAQRQVWGERLAQGIGAELGDLGLGKARLEVHLERRLRTDSPLLIDDQAVEFGREGFDQVVFWFAPNPGEEARPLAKIASGGELSRLYLALQLVLQAGAFAVGRGAQGKKSRRPAKVDDLPSPSRTASSLPSMPPTMVFDEVDAGVGGAEAAALGAKLQRLATDGQILAVTHLPQVASSGDAHFRVSKRTEGGRTRVAIERLDADARAEEIARMLAGAEVTPLSLSHAREILAGAARPR